VSVVYLSEPGSTLAASSRTLVVRRDGQELAQLPVLGVERVVVLAPAHLTSAAVALCAREQVELVVVARGAQVLARLGASEAGLALRAAQHRRADDAAFCLALARAVVRGKVRNQRRLLGRSRSATEPAVAAARAEMQALAELVPRAESIASLRGLEGRASAVYFRAMRTMVNPEYGFRGRNRRPPRDAVNAMLSFAYTLLTAEAAAAVCAAGLEPALGFFHRARGGRPALALDLVEELRAPAADALMLHLTGRRVIGPDEFRVTAERGARMRRPARRRLVASYEAKLAHPFDARDGGQTTLRDALRAQARLLAEAVLTGEPYAPFQLA
jgi:CRISP-associated protein Cas1